MKILEKEILATLRKISGVLDRIAELLTRPKPLWLKPEWAPFGHSADMKFFEDPDNG